MSLTSTSLCAEAHNAIGGEGGASGKANKIQQVARMAAHQAARETGRADGREDDRLVARMASHMEQGVDKEVLQEMAGYCHIQAGGRHCLGGDAALGSLQWKVEKEVRGDGEWRVSGVAISGDKGVLTRCIHVLAATANSSITQLQDKV